MTRKNWEGIVIRNSQRINESVTWGKKIPKVAFSPVGRVVHLLLLSGFGALPFIYLIVLVSSSHLLPKYPQGLLGSPIIQEGSHLFKALSVISPCPPRASHLPSPQNVNSAVYPAAHHVPD